MTPRQFASLAQRAVSAWIDDRAPSMGAAIAYYTLFSMAPLLLIVVSVAGLLFGPDAARGEIFAQLHGFIGAEGASAVQALLESVNRPTGGLLASATGVLLMLVGATTVFAELQSALDTIWKAPPSRHHSLWVLLRTRLLSFGLILGLGFLLVVSLLFNAALAALKLGWQPWLGDWAGLALLVNAIDLLIGFVLMTLLFAMIYKLLPRARIAWRDVWVGALATSALFALGRSLIGWYIGSGAVGSGFGAAGALVVVMVWVYYSAQIFLLGAEFTCEYAHMLGSRRGLKPGHGQRHTAPSYMP